MRKLSRRCKNLKIDYIRKAEDLLKSAQSLDPCTDARIAARYRVLREYNTPPFSASSAHKLQQAEIKLQAFKFQFPLAKSSIVFPHFTLAREYMRDPAKSLRRRRQSNAKSSINRGSNGLRPYVTFVTEIRGNRIYIRRT